MTVRKLNDGKAKLWIADCYPEGRLGPRKRRRFATKGEALAWEAFVMADEKPWQAEATDERRLIDLVQLWYGRHGQTLTDGERRRNKLFWLCEALGNP